MVWTVSPSKKPMVLCISTNSYCFVWGSTVGGPVPGRMGLQQGIPLYTLPWYSKFCVCSLDAEGYGWELGETPSVIKTWTSQEVIARLLTNLSTLLFRVLRSLANSFSALGQPSWGKKKDRKQKQSLTQNGLHCWVSAKWLFWVSDNFFIFK